MNRAVVMITLGLLGGVSYGLYSLKYEVRALERRATELRIQTARDRAAIKTLHAEWSYLARPSRLDALARRFLALQPARPEQVGMVAELNMRPLGGDAAGQNDDLKLLMPRARPTRLVLRPGGRP